MGRLLNRFTPNVSDLRDDWSCHVFPCDRAETVSMKFMVPVAVLGDELPDNTTHRIVVLDITRSCIFRRIWKARPLEENVLKEVSQDICATEDFRARRILFYQFLVLVKVFVKLRIIGYIRMNLEGLRC
jgi:hypothetical protein